jgi:hypothetical protein
MKKKEIVLMGIGFDPVGYPGQAKYKNNLTLIDKM